MALVRRLQHGSVGVEGGREAHACAFSGDALGLAEKSRPIRLTNSPVIWFDAGDDRQAIHLMATSHSVTSESNYPCLEVEDRTAMRARMRQHAVPLLEVEEIAIAPAVW